MGNLTCTNDARTERLAATLEREHAVSRQAMDAGAPRLHIADNGSAISTEWIDAGDGCSTYQEVLGPTIDIATRKALFAGDIALLQTLKNEHGLTLPWIIPNSDTGEILNQETWTAIALQAEAIALSVIDSGLAVGSSEYRLELGKRLFETFMPIEELRIGGIDPQMGAFRLYTACLAAGLPAHFVFVPNGPRGASLSTHVALAIELDADSEIIADPAWGVFGLSGLETIPITSLQAISRYETHRALMSKKDSLKRLERAITCDPFNASAHAYQMHAAVDSITDPLWPFRRLHRWQIQSDRAFFDDPDAAPKDVPAPFVR